MSKLIISLSLISAVFFTREIKSDRLSPQEIRDFSSYCSSRTDQASCEANAERNRCGWSDIEDAQGRSAGRCMFNGNTSKGSDSSDSDSDRPKGKKK